MSTDKRLRPGRERWRPGPKLAHRAVCHLL